LLSELGFDLADVAVVPDEIDMIEAAMREAIGAGVDLVASTGGTGMSPRDVTPEATRRVIDREAPGLAEALRQYRRDEIPTTILSRALAGVAGRTLVVNLPGSPGGVRDGVAVLAPVIGHAITQLRGGDH
jgi:molybdenum cofactor synthesis domain-containing protein